jgi:hypothetical protein
MVDGGSAADAEGTATRLTSVRRSMVGFEQDEVGDWVALLECGHRQHVRHRPPWQVRPWVVTDAGRRSRLGQPLECADCDAAVEQGGDPACWAGRVCPACGAVDEEGHRPGCDAGPETDSS